MEHLKADVQDFGLNTFGDSNASCGCIAGCLVEKELYEPRQFFHFVVDIWLIATRKSLKPWQCSRSSQLVEFPSRSETHHLLHELFCWPDKILLTIPGNKWKNEGKKIWPERVLFCFFQDGCVKFSLEMFLCRISFSHSSTFSYFKVGVSAATSDKAAVNLSHRRSEPTQLNSTWTSCSTELLSRCFLWWISIT